MEIGGSRPQSREVDSVARSRTTTPLTDYLVDEPSTFSCVEGEGAVVTDPFGQSHRRGRLPRRVGDPRCTRGRLLRKLVGEGAVPTDLFFDAAIPWTLGSCRNSAEVIPVGAL